MEIIFQKQVKVILITICLILFSTNLISQEFNISDRSNNEIKSLDSLISLHISQVQPDSIGQTMTQLQNMTTRFMLAPNRKQVAEWLKARFISVGCETTVIDSFQTHSTINISGVNYDTTTWQYNVIATLSGAVNPEKIVVIGGHYDCFSSMDPMAIAPGADDNGSMVAATLEIARVLNNSGYVPNKTIRFVAFAAEELMNFSTTSGARDLAFKYAENEENILLYINNDMIAFQPTASDWIFDFMVHDPDAWYSQLALELTSAYTSLTPNVYNISESKTDDIPFWEAGYHTVLLMEHTFNTYYHTPDDLVENCNLEYCAEITRLDLALTMAIATMPGKIDPFYLNSLYDGQSLEASWNSSDENDLDHYEIYFGKDPENLNEFYSTTDTTFLFAGLMKDTTYFAKIFAVNQNGYRSIPSLKQAHPAVVTLDQGVLVIAGSQDGLLNATQEEIDQFYDSICHNFAHDHYGYDLLEELSLEDIGKYSSVIWHCENPEVTIAGSGQMNDMLNNYVYLGGNLMYTGFKPSMVFGSTPYPASFKKGDFMYDRMKVEASKNEAARFFSGALPESSEWPPLYVDSLKMPAFNYHLPFVEVFTPAVDGEIVYRYDTEYDTTSIQGAYYNLPVGVFPVGEKKQTFILSFPLYYMNREQSSTLIYKILTGCFNEAWLGTDDPTANWNTDLTVYPNPAKGHVTFSMRMFKRASSRLLILDGSGREIENELLFFKPGTNFKYVWDAGKYAPGIYFYVLETDNKSYSGKIITNK